jgi:hypothetical protein
MEHVYKNVTVEFIVDVTDMLNQDQYADNTIQKSVIEKAYDDPSIRSISVTCIEDAPDYHED